MSDSQPVSNPVEARPIPVARPIRLAGAVARSPSSPLTLPMLSKRAAVFDLAVILLVGFSLPFVLQIAFFVWSTDGQWPPLEPEADPLPVMLAFKTFEMFLVAGILAVLVLLRAPAKSYGLSRRDPLVQLLWTIGGLVGAYSWLAITVVVLMTAVFLFPPLANDLMNRQEAFSFVQPAEPWKLVLLMVPVAIHEEILFRALLLTYLRRLTGTWWAAVLISTLVFAVLHFDQGFLGVFQVAGLGAIFAITFILSRSLPAVIVAHFIFNTVQLQLMRLVPFT
jgi:membrane protease YdiL (CAAX protease family)